MQQAVAMDDRCGCKLAQFFPNSHVPPSDRPSLLLILCWALYLPSCTALMDEYVEWLSVMGKDALPETPSVDWAMQAEDQRQEKVRAQTARRQHGLELTPALLRLFRS